jgi:hypothetical protein
LDLDQQSGHLIFDPADLKVLAIEGTVEYLAAIVVSHQCAALRPPLRLSPVGKARTGSVSRRYQIRRTAVDRDFEDSSREPRAIHDRLVVTGQESCAIAQLAYAQRPEIAFKKAPCLRFSEPTRSNRLAGCVTQSQIATARPYGSTVLRGGARPELKLVVAE